jgi:hypothetical protein
VARNLLLTFEYIVTGTDFEVGSANTVRCFSGHGEEPHTR